jgi:hypothetical protein
VTPEEAAQTRIRAGRGRIRNPAAGSRCGEGTAAAEATGALRSGLGGPYARRSQPRHLPEPRRHRFGDGSVDPQDRPDRARLPQVTAWELAPPEEGPELRKQRLDNFLTFWGPGGLASPDDVEALETCQRGFAARGEVQWSDISRGMNKPFAVGSDEPQIRTWWRRWNQLITGEQLPPEPQAPLPAVYTAVPTRRPESVPSS